LLSENSIHCQQANNASEAGTHRSCVCVCVQEEACEIMAGYVKERVCSMQMRVCDEESACSLIYPARCHRVQAATMMLQVE